MTKLSDTAPSKKLYAVYDKSAEAFNDPFCCVTDSQAVRAVESAVTNPSSDISRFPEDFVLYYLGEYVFGNGVIDSVEPRRIIDARSLLNEIKQRQTELSNLNSTEKQVDIPNI